MFLLYVFAKTDGGYVKNVELRMNEELRNRRKVWDYARSAQRKKQQIVFILAI